jgi:site-specific DNA recombinase
MHNPVYCGRIFVPNHKDEDAYFVQGLHEPIVSKKLFKEAQDVMNWRKKASMTKIISFDHLPLRGFLVCPLCGRN